MLGGPLLGVAFTLDYIDINVFFKAALFMTAVLFGAIHIFTLNDWLGYAFDKGNPKKIDSPLVSGRVSLKKVRLLSLISGFLSLFLLVILSLRSFVVAVLIIASGICHDHPRVLLKGKPLLGIAINILGGGLLFLLGYGLFNPIDERGILIALYFALLMSGGYLNHAIVDYETDIKSNISTFAVRFGKSRAALASFAIFSLSTLYFLILSLLGIVPQPFGVIVLIVYIFYSCLLLYLCRRRPAFSTMEAFIVSYHKLYGVMGLYMWLYLMLKLRT
jgi:4-hydroxybenzoate polyprenyltransferase